MKVNEFIEFYNTMNNKKSVWNKIGLLHYVPFKLKADTAMNIIRDNFKMENGQVIKNTPALYVLNRMCAVMVYCPNLEISADNALSDYDLLNGSGVLEEILKEVGKDINEFDTIFTMTFEDYIANTSSTNAIVHNILNTFAEMCNRSIDSILEYLNGSDVKNILSILSATGDDGK